MRLLIEVDCHDDDFDWLRHKCVAAVEDAVATAEDEGRLDGPATVHWDSEDE